jgi:hypothetical protein
VGKVQSLQLAGGGESMTKIFGPIHPNVVVLNVELSQIAVENCIFELDENVFVEFDVVVADV